MWINDLYVQIHKAYKTLLGRSKERSVKISIQIDHQPDATVFSVYYPDVYLQLNMFRAFSRPSSGAQRMQQQPLVLPSYRGDSRAVFVVVEILMMGGRTPETC
jgi:hypothetical protein